MVWPIWFEEAFVIGMILITVIVIREAFEIGLDLWNNRKKFRFGR